MSSVLAGQWVPVSLTVYLQVLQQQVSKVLPTLYPGTDVALNPRTWYEKNNILHVSYQVREKKSSVPPQLGGSFFGGILGLREFGGYAYPSDFLDLKI